MHDIFPEYATQTAPLAYYRVDRMLLSPRHWKSCALASRLTWTPVRFNSANLSKVPSDQRGVYSFLVKPGIADHNDVAYLVYVGKVEKQFFRARFSQYLRHFRKGKDSNWYHVAAFLTMWQGYLWFYWAPVTVRNKIHVTERALISAFLPPANHKFEGKVKSEVKAVFK